MTFVVLTHNSLLSYHLRVEEEGNDFDSDCLLEPMTSSIDEEDQSGISCHLSSVGQRRSLTNLLNSFSG